MQSVPIFAFSAFSGTGKTTVIEKLVSAFTAEGYAVAVIKHDGHDFEIDREGKDSYRFTSAGAVVSLISSKNKTAVIESRKLDLNQLVNRIHDVDIILVEGYKNASLPRIGIARKACGKGFTDSLDKFITIMSDYDDIDTQIPHFHIDDIEGLKSFIMKNMSDFTHFNDEGRAKMVDVGEKPENRRCAVAGARVLISPETYTLIKNGGMKKGDVLTVAQIAGIMGAKRTADLIPMCHNVFIEGVNMKLSLDEELCCVDIKAEVNCDGKTGIEMEALTAVSVAALTVYDMCKAVQKDIVISDVRLISKSGGAHGDFVRKED
ncbi:MAG: cyclic pyranopterin monophosphate synthase MoaC [Oscillospiraceae bacterium]|nr:cyclic pyranopterin monophosphate synthase MoaC [Oscillospiraceae bacterium]